MLQRVESIHDLLDRLVGGDDTALATLFAHYREQLKREIERDLADDPRLESRFDASDVVQEVFRDAQLQIAGYLTNRDRIEFVAWLRGLARERRLKFQRDHLQAQCRSLKRQQTLPDDSAHHPAAEQESPSAAARTAERDERLQRAMSLLGADEQDVIRWRVYEGLTNAELAERYGLTAAAAAKRFARAMGHLRKVLAQLAKGKSDENVFP
jgi:RNA polymerase sigma-70 factor (ECF subfamily)